jgi:hypothetical protein
MVAASLPTCKNSQAKKRTSPSSPNAIAGAARLCTSGSLAVCQPPQAVRNPIPRRGAARRAPGGFPLRPLRAWRRVPPRFPGIFTRFAPPCGLHPSIACGGVYHQRAQRKCACRVRGGLVAARLCKGHRAAQQPGATGSYGCSRQPWLFRGPRLLYRRFRASAKIRTDTDTSTRAIDTSSLPALPPLRP